MLGNNGSRLASWLISFMPMSRWHGLKCWLLRKIGGIQIGERCTIYSGTRFVGRYIKIGSDCHFGHDCEICGLSPDAWVTIGDWVSMGPEVFMTTGTHSSEAGKNHRTNGIQLPITIGDRVGLSVRCMIMAGVTIGSDSIITPGVCVSKNVPAHSLIGSAPVRRLPFGE